MTAPPAPPATKPTVHLGTCPTCGLTLQLVGGKRGKLAVHSPCEPPNAVLSQVRASVTGLDAMTTERAADLVLRMAVAKLTDPTATSHDMAATVKAIADLAKATGQRGDAGGSSSMLEFLRATGE